MADARVGRDDSEVLQTLLSPPEEGVALDVALHFELGIEGEGIGCAEFVHLHGMVDHQFSREQRIDSGRIAAEFSNGIAHRGEIHHSRNARENLEQDASGHKGDLLLRGPRGARWVPAGQNADIVSVNEVVVLMPEKVFEQDFQRKWKTRDVVETGTRARGKAVNFKGIAANA